MRIGTAVHVEELRKWAEYCHSTRWRRTIIKALEEAKFVYVDEDEYVHLLRRGEAAAERLMLKAA